MILKCVVEKVEYKTVFLYTNDEKNTGKTDANTILPTSTILEIEGIAVRLWDEYQEGETFTRLVNIQKG